ncbi:hypothetical protein [Alkalicoccus luteus]|uniref:Uncharacterized protein n=1 Tax=Alkalicoccus luteus TaxID=1237094 RepID=A0A969PS01_9BACI|nr:hypothetical protein [Alkalicoccus luteus]NJP39327.1 hypothetical protein [Alkalicoccus luteus]
MNRFSYLILAVPFYLVLSFAMVQVVNRVLPVTDTFFLLLLTLTILLINLLITKLTLERVIPRAAKLI